MNRREILKLSLFAPLLGLFKSRKSGASTGFTEIPTCGGAKAVRELRKTYESSGTSSDTAVWRYSFKLPEDRLLDPNSRWAKLQAERYKEMWDEIVIKLYG